MVTKGTKPKESPGVGGWWKIVPSRVVGRAMLSFLALKFQTQSSSA